MNRPPSLADNAVAALAAVAQMDAGMDLQHPERHLIWQLKSQAEATIADALRTATSLALTARHLRELARELERKAPT